MRPKSSWLRRVTGLFRKVNNRVSPDIEVALDDFVVEPTDAEVETATAYLFWARGNAHAEGCMCRPCTDARQILSDGGKLYETFCMLDELPRG
jgi:hypothetical protein